MMKIEKGLIITGSNKRLKQLYTATLSDKYDKKEVVIVSAVKCKGKLCTKDLTEGTKLFIINEITTTDQMLAFVKEYVFFGRFKGLKVYPDRGKPFVVGADYILIAGENITEADLMAVPSLYEHFNLYNTDLGF